uniref:DUF4283 domain-containing protein n=1 Tax=Nelumbo nucifera TaxID=4432 RepID=A0A822ZVX3_NELNU|nr:TPA_asm: hypothetical protein HUJ06_019100 [Nelumbo nucifera]
MDQHMAALSLMDEEEEELILEQGTESESLVRYDMCLVGCFLTDRSINFNVTKHRMASIWRPRKGVGGPWTYDNHVLLLHHLKPGEIPNQIHLFHVDYWVQVYDLPVGFMSINVGKQLGNFIGEFCRI